MNGQSVKNLIESDGKLITNACWEFTNNNSQGKKYVWIIDLLFYPYQLVPGTVTKHINVKDEFSIHFTGTYIQNPTIPLRSAQNYLPSFEFRSDTPMNGVISKITVVQGNPQENQTIETVSSDSKWMKCKSGSNYCNSSNEQWKFEALIPTFTLNVPDRVFTYNSCIIVIIEFINTSIIGIPLDIVEQQEDKHAALVLLNSKLYDSRENGDFEMKVKGSKLMAHKNILEGDTGSSVFKAMMETNMVEKNKNAIEIDDYEPEIIEEVLKYIYTGEANLVDHPVQLFKCSDKYDIPGLVDSCEKYIAKNISAVGYTKIFEIFHLYGERVPLLKKSAEDYFKMNENVLIESEEFQNAVRLYLKEFADLYMSKKRKREED